MVVDTGAPVTLLEAEAALAHRVQIIQPDLLRNYFRGLAGDEETYFGMIQRMGIGPELAFRNTLTAIRTERYSRKLGGLITVLKWQSHSLGFSTLGNFAFLTLDYPARQMTFSRRDFFVEPPAAVARLPLALTNAQIRVPMTLAGREFSALLDTGNDAALMVSSNVVAELGWADLAARGKPEVFVGLGGEMTLRSFVAPEIQLGGTTFRDVRIVSGPPEFGVTLGSGFLHAYRVTLDLRRKQLWLEKSSP